MDSKLTDDGLKIYGQGKAQVIAVKSSGDSHLVRIIHPDIGATNYIPFIQTPGIYRVPRLGDSCYIFFDENFHQYPIAWGHRLSKDLIESLVGKRADNITVLYSSGEGQDSIGHKIELDDGTKKGIRLTTLNNHIIDIDDLSDITIKHKDGAKATVGKDKIELNIKNNLITLDSSGILLQDSNGNKIQLGGAGISIESSDGSKINVGATITVEASDTKTKVDQVIVSTHPHLGNLSVPTDKPVPNT